MCPHLFGIIGVALNSMFVCCIVNHAGHMISPYPVMFPSTLTLVFVSDLHRSNDFSREPDRLLFALDFSAFTGAC